ncbi:uncharacterized protein LTR77_002476 [Saxophila tyrrhenica]|uniref:DNA2/NAM7 helicase-like C-terminal domain-containing protein n=1 Tax=Saxophila tyrrhenica TaxID=1690608 RepID=A0AAV9PJ99_9PEZI|nr:hypothetical protein LTR77_002476 [Saxophila tyrrhenica]
MELTGTDLDLYDGLEPLTRGPTASTGTTSFLMELHMQLITGPLRALYGKNMREQFMVITPYKAQFKLYAKAFQTLQGVAA